MLIQPLFLQKKSIPSARADPSSVIHDDLPPSSPGAIIREQLEGTKVVETEVEKVVEVENPEEVEKLVEVELEVVKVVKTKVVDVDVTQPKSPEVVARDPEKGEIHSGIPSDNYSFLSLLLRL
ncbi:hypothetical protein Hanom_Chr10g00938221 [Helianthus anomalus]